MKKNLILLFILLLLTGCNTNEKDNVKDEGTLSDEILKEEIELKDEGLTLKIEQFDYNDDYTNVNMSITNNNDYDIYIESYEIYFYDQNNILLGKLTPVFDGNLLKGEKISQMFGTELDLSKTHHVEYNFIGIRKI